MLGEQKLSERAGYRNRGYSQVRRADRYGHLDMSVMSID